MDQSLEVKLGLNWQAVRSGYGVPPDGQFGGRSPYLDHFPGTSHFGLHFSEIIGLIMNACFIFQTAISFKD